MIETLAVIAVSATLGSIIVSSVKASKDIAIQATCMSNIAQIRDVTELYRKDHGSLPYSEIWMTDFSYAKDYLDEGNALNIFKCPGSDDYEVTQHSQLTHNTSYYYVANGAQLAKNIDDAAKYGIDATQANELIASQNGIIYDKSDSHHNGKVNIAYLYRDDDNDALLEGKSGTISSVGDSNLLDLDGANIVNLPEVAIAETNDQANVDNADQVDTQADDNDAQADDKVDITIDADTITLDEEATAIYTVLGAAISYGGKYDMAVTTQFQITSPDGNSAATPVFGDYGNAVDGNVNNGEQQTYTPDSTYTAGTVIETEATSWKKRRSSLSGDSSSHWRVYMEVDDSNTTNTKVLSNGDTVPNIDGYLDQGDVESFLDGYINEDGTVNLGENQVIILFELGTTNMSSSAADFQDLVILVTFVPAK